MSEVKASQRVSALEKIGYGLGDTASNIVFQTLMLLMPYFYTDVFGLSAAAMGTMFLLVRVGDAVADPIMGSICDRTSTRWGKFRPYLLWVAVPYAIVAILTFTTPDLDAQGKLIWAYVTYGLLMLVYTAINIPYCALGGVITADTRERVSLQSYRFVLATLAGVLVASATLPLVAWLGQGNDQKGYQLAMVLMGSLAVVMFLASFFFTRERVTQATEQVVSFWNDVRVLLRNDQWRIIAGVFFVLLIGLVIRGGGALYYVTWFARRKDLGTAFLTVGMIGQTVGAGCAGLLTKRLSKSRSYMLLQAVMAALSVAMFFLGSGSIALMFVLFGAIQFFSQMTSPILWAMMSDTVDYGEHKTGRRITGLVFSGALFFLKLGMALGGALLGWMLAYYGYRGGAEVQTPQAIRGIVITFTLVPAVFHFLVIPIVSRYKLSDARYDVIRAELDRQAEAAARSGGRGSASSAPA
jgi:GPH family glycoside/pentoside/hexuronide:cation symporter